MAPGEVLRRCLLARRSVELLGQRAAGGRIGAHRRHEAVAAFDQRGDCLGVALEAGQPEMKLRRAERREIIGAAAVVAVAGVAPHRRAALREQCLIDRIVSGEQALQAGERRLGLRIERAVRAVGASGVIDRENRRDIELFARLLPLIKSLCLLTL